MRRADWFTLIQEWKAKGMGQTGVTLPFLIGALANKSGRNEWSSQDVHYLIEEIVRHPEKGYVIEVNWCHNIHAPVLSAASIDDKHRMPLKSCFTAENGDPSLGFTQSIQSTKVNIKKARYSLTGSILT